MAASRNASTVSQPNRPIAYSLTGLWVGLISGRIRMTAARRIWYAMMAAPASRCVVMPGTSERKDTAGHVSGRHGAVPTYLVQPADDKERP